MERKLMPHSVRGVEIATTKPGATKLRRTLVNGKSEMLPDDPHEVVQIFRERRASPAMRLRARILADLKKRGH